MTDLVPANIQVPAHLAGRIGAPSVLGTAVAGGIGSGTSAPRISIKGARFRIVNDGVETVLNATTLDAVIVGANPRLSKVWYASKWTPDNEPNMPDCFSLDGISPDPDSPHPQHDVCATCPHNQWGSLITESGMKAKACSDQKRLAIVAADDPEGPVYLLAVTPAALKNLNQYQKALASRGIQPETVRTRVGFDTDASFPKLTFSFAGFISAEAQAVVDGLLGSETVRDITGETRADEVAALRDANLLHVTAAPAAPPVPEAVAPAPVQAVPQAPAPAAEDPTPVRGFGAPTAAAAPPATKPAPKPAAKRAAPKPAAAPAGGFAAQAAPEAPAAPAPAPATTAPAEAAAAKVVAAGDDLAAEIAALVGAADADDA